MIYAVFLTGIGFNAAASFVLKILTEKSEELISLATLKSPWLYLAIFLFGLNIIFYALFLRHVNLAVGYPAFVGGTFAIVLLLAFFFLRETLSLSQTIGIVLIFGGILLALR